MNQILHGDCIDRLREIPDGIVNTCVTSPPYFGLRDYGVEGQIGLECTPDAYVAKLVDVFREVRRVLRDDGTLWLNLGDSYATNGGAHGGRADNQQGVGAKRTHEAGGGDQQARRAPVGLKAKDLIGIPWRVAFALQADGWYLRQDIIWHKPNPMPESVRDRCTKAHEYLFLLSKSEKYFFDGDAIKEPAVCADSGRESKKRGQFAGKNGGQLPGREPFRAITETRNRRSVWTVATRPYSGAHFATFPSDLIEPCILAGSPVGGLVLDPFMGSGTTAAVAVKMGRKYLGTELNPEYIKLAEKRIAISVDNAGLFYESGESWN